MITHKYYRNFLEWNTSGTALLPLFLNGDEPNVSIPGTYGLQEVIHNIIGDTKGLRNAIITPLTDANFSVGSTYLTINTPIALFLQGRFWYYTTPLTFAKAGYGSYYVIFTLVGEVPTLSAVADYKLYDCVVLGQFDAGLTSFTCIVDKTYVRTTSPTVQTMLDTLSHEYVSPYVLYRNGLNEQITGTVSFNATDVSTFYYNSNLRIKIWPTYVNIPYLTCTDFSTANGTVTLRGSTVVTIQSPLNMWNSGAEPGQEKQDITNVADFDCNYADIADTDIGTATITSISNATNFTGNVPTVDSNVIVDVGHFPHIIYDANPQLYFNLNLAEFALTEARFTTSGYYYAGSGVRIIATESSSLTAYKFVKFNTSGLLVVTGDDSSPCVGMKKSGSGSSVEVIVHGVCRFITSNLTGDVGKVVYKAADGGFTTDPSALAFVQPIGVLINCTYVNPNYWSEVLVNPSPVVIQQ